MELKLKSKSAPTLSILLMKQTRGTLYLVACRQTVSDWASTPSLPSNTATAPSSTRSERSTSAVKSTWPGVSIRLIVYRLAVAVPRTGGGGGVDRDAALLLFLVKVHDGGAFMYLAHLVDLPGVIEDALGDGGFARVDVGGNADVTNFGKIASHKNFLLLLEKSISTVRPTADQSLPKPTPAGRRKSEVM